MKKKEDVINEINNNFEKLKVKNVEVTLSDLFLLQLQIKSEQEAILYVLKNIIKNNNIELKDNYGNVYDFDEYVNMLKKQSVTISFEIIDEMKNLYANK